MKPRSPSRRNGVRCGRVLRQSGLEIGTGETVRERELGRGPINVPRNTLPSASAAARVASRSLQADLHLLGMMWIQLRARGGGEGLGRQANAGGRREQFQDLRTVPDL